jgi:hypothetical protein
MEVLEKLIKETKIKKDKAEEAKKHPRDSMGRLKPGYGSLNPGGVSRDQRTAQNKLHKALIMVEKSEGKSFLQHYIEQAFKDKTMAIALLKKIVPDLKAVEVDSKHNEVWQVILKSFAEQNTEQKND